MEQDSSEFQVCQESFDSREVVATFGNEELHKLKYYLDHWWFRLVDEPALKSETHSDRTWKVLQPKFGPAALIESGPSQRNQPSKFAHKLSITLGHKPKSPISPAETIGVYMLHCGYYKTYGTVPVEGATMSKPLESFITHFWHKRKTWGQLLALDSTLLLVW